MVEGDLFTADTTTQSSIEKQLRALISNYDEKIIELKNVSKDIRSSDSWVDTNIKENFLHTLDSYITSFEALKQEMIVQVDELSNTTTSIDNIESAFS